MIYVFVFNETELNNLIFIVSPRFGSRVLHSSGDPELKNNIIVKI